MRSCLGEPLVHSLRPYITTLNFLSRVEFFGLSLDSQLAVCAGVWVAELGVAAWIPCFKVAA